MRQERRIPTDNLPPNLVRQRIENSIKFPTSIEYYTKVRKRKGSFLETGKVLKRRNPGRSHVLRVYEATLGGVDELARAPLLKMNEAKKLTNRGTVAIGENDNVICKR